MKFLLKICVQILFCRLNTFMSKGKDLELDPDSYLWRMDPDSYLWWMDPDSYLWRMDPDPGGPKTCGCGSGSGSPTLPRWSGQGRESVTTLTTPLWRYAMWQFFLRLMSAHLDILGRVIPSSPPLDLKQYTEYRYTNVDKSHPLILNYHEKVSGYVPL